MKLIVCMKKKALKTSEVKHLYAPQYSSLSIKELLQFVGQYGELEHYFPEAKDFPMLPRQVSYAFPLAPRLDVDSVHNLF